MGAAGHPRVGLVLGFILAVGVGWLFSLWHHPYGLPSRRVRPARRGVLLMNPLSGGGKVIRFDLVEEARRRGIKPLLLEQGGDLRELAETAVADGADVLGVAGGDGSQAIVADVARAHDLPFVCVPAGLHNHFAIDLGLDRNDIMAALDGFGEAVERRIDLAVVGNRVFVNNATLGLHNSAFTDNRNADRQREAELTTAGAMGPELASQADGGLRFDGPDGIPVAAADLVLVSNNPYLTRRPAGGGTRPRLDSAQLGVVVIRRSRPGEDPAAGYGAVASAAEPGTGAAALPDVEEWSTSTFRMESPDPIPTDLDGETMHLPPPLEFRILPGALRVRIPRSAPGATRTRRGFRDALRGKLRR